MGVGLKLTPKLGSPIQSRFITNSPSKFASFSVSRGKEASMNLTRPSFVSVVSEDDDILYKFPLKTYAYSSAIPTLENDRSEMEGTKINVDKRYYSGLNNMIDNNEVSVQEDNVTPHASLKKRRTSRFSLLLDNLDTLEKSFADSDASKLERDILMQLGRLGALNFFNARLSRTLETSNALDSSDVPYGNIGESKASGKLNDPVGKIIVRTGKKEERKSRRERAASQNGNKATLMAIQNDLREHFFSPDRKPSSSRSIRSTIARNEAEMSKGVKVVSDLERIRTTLVEQTGQGVSLSCWAEAAGLDKKVLWQHLLFGWYCRDELIRSTQSLVLFLARNYRGMGIAMEDLLQAGNLGVLQGAERFDPTRGYRFSTYVQYWIRKSMLKIVERHARGIQIPYQLSQARKKIQKARKTLSNSHGKHPDDSEVAKFTGLSLAKIEAADKCLRVVASSDQPVGESLNAKYLEFIPDMSIPSPEEAVMRQNMRTNIHDLLRSLDSRERQVLALRNGFKDHQLKSLAEIGRRFHVSKECVRKIEKKVMKRLRDEETCRNLSHYRTL